jgi:hypothetical protein
MAHEKSKSEDVMTTAAIRLSSLCVAAMLISSLAGAQSTNSAPSAVVPRLVNFSGKAIAGGKVITGAAGATFAIYSEQSEGAPLWIETQNIQADARGNFTVQLGATKTEGLPLDLFTSGDARWLGVTINGGEEQPRVLLVAVPYALKAADAETVGGLPPSAFVLAAPPISGATSSPAASTATASTGAVSTGAVSTGSANSVASPAATSDVTTSGGTINALPLFSTASNIQNSAVAQTGSGATANIGIRTTTPATALDVNGGTTVRGTLALAAAGTATAAKGFNSQPLDFTASVFNSTTETAVPQKFQWQAEPLNNNTATASGTINLLYATGTAALAETGLKISPKGILTFAAGQTFPIPSASVTNADLQHSSITLTAGTGLSGGGAIPLGGATTLSLNTGTIPVLTLNNSFTGNNVFNPSATDAIDAYTAGPGKTALVGIENATSGGSYGVWAETFDSTGAGVRGANRTAAGIGVFGQNESESATGSGLASTFGGGGVWGDGGTTKNNWGVIGTADDGHAGIFENNSPSGYPTVFIWSQYEALNGNTGPLIAGAPGGSCSIDVTGSLGCTGQKNAIVPIDGGKRMVAMSAMESPQNWFEDAGSAQLVNGAATIALDPDFIQTVNTEKEYMVFPVPNGDCKGLYVSNQTPTSFEVHELGGGSSNVHFYYRIMALRKNYENVRFADHTHEFEIRKMLQKQVEMKGAQQQPQSHTPQLHTPIEKTAAGLMK